MQTQTEYTFAMDVEKCVLALISRQPPVWHDKTDWASVLPALTNAGQIYFGVSGGGRGKEQLARAVTGIAQVVNGGAPVWCSIGPVACSDTGGYARCLLAWQAALHMEDLGPLVRGPGFYHNANAALLLANQALRCITGAMPWPHGESVMPAQLSNAYHSRVQCLCAVLEYALLDPRGARCTALDESRAAVAILQRVYHYASMFPGVKAWATAQLRCELSHALSLHKADARYNGAQQTYSGPDLYGRVFALTNKLPVRARPRTAVMLLASSQSAMVADQHRYDECVKAHGNGESLLYAPPQCNTSSIAQPLSTAFFDLLPTPVAFV